MAEVSGIGSPQHVLWTIGTSLIEAGPGDAEAQLQAALAEVCSVVGAVSGGVFEHDPTTQQTAMLVGHGVTEDSMAPTRPGVVRPELVETGGHALMTLEELFDDHPATRRWPNGQAIVSLIDETEERIVTLFIMAFDSAWNDEELEVLRGFGLLVRQFMRRVDAEARLRQRRVLDASALDIADRLQGLSGADFDIAIESLLAQVMGAVDGHACFLVDIIDAQSCRVPVLVTRGMSMPALGDLSIDDINAFTGADATDMFDLLSATRIFNASELADAVLGEGTAEHGEAMSEPRSVVLVPAEVAGFSATAIGVSRSAALPWTSAEIDAVSTIVSMLTQARARCAAEADAQARLEAEEVLSAIADDFLGGSARTAIQVETQVLDRLASLLDLQGSVIGGAPPDTRVERMWRHPDFTGPGTSIGASVPPDAIPYDRLDPSAPIELTADGDSPTAAALRERWGGANVLFGPVVVDGMLVAAISAIRHGSFDGRDRAVLRSVAGMLGQFRARVAAEQRDEARLRAEQLLSDFAGELADATADTLRESVNSAFMNICHAMDLTCFTIWRIDTDLEAYRAVYRAVPDDGEGAQLPEPRSFGSDAMLDAARLADDWVISADHSTDDPTLNVVAFRRGSEPRESILITKSRNDNRWPAETLELFREVSKVLRDVEARVAAERYVDAAFDNAPVGIVLRDDRLRLITCNLAFTDFLGYPSPADLAGSMPDHVYAEGIEAIEWIDRAGRLEAEAAFRRYDGGRVWGHMRATVVEGDAGDHFWLVHVEDITDRRRAEALLRFQATHDELTGLANRGRLIQELDELAAAPEGVAVLLLDLDRFKNINDSLGHDRGDELLVTIADRLRLAVRPGDLVARLGGDEFAVTLAGPVTPTDAEFVANRLLRLIGEPVTLGAQKLYPSASIGIAFSDTRDVADLLRRADTAMYRAKAQGRAQAALFDEALQLEVTERMATEAGLRGALRNSEFLVYYQPEVSTEDGAMLGAEALIRWNHPTRGVLAAGNFIEVAEETGLVVEMGELVLSEAVAEAARWPGGDDGPTVRVNLAAAQLQRDDTVALVRFALQETGLAPHRLCLEITESAVMTDIRRSEQILHRLKELGVQLAVDDFGTGFSSLAYLKRFPVDALKIDRAFVIGLGEDDEDRAFVSSIISLADALGLDVVAEGVETEVQATVLGELGCHRAQGYLYARPGPPQDLAAFLPGHQDA